MSACSSAGILGTGHYAPERLLTNFDLEKLVDTTDEWIRTRTGVEGNKPKLARLILLLLTLQE